MIPVGYLQSKIDEVMVADTKYNEVLVLERQEKTDKDKEKEGEEEEEEEEEEEKQDPTPTPQASTSTSPKKRRGTKRQRALAAKKKKKEEESHYKSRSEREKELKKRQNIIGSVPPPPKHQDFQPLDLPFGFQTLGEYNRLQTYLLWNGPYLVKTTPADGACMFHALVDMLDCEQEFTQIHARRMVVLLVAEHPEFFYNLLKKDLQGEYGNIRLTEQEVAEMKEKGEYTGAVKKNQELPGPFSLVGWMRYMLRGDSWGDSAVLKILPYLFQCPLITIDGSTLVSKRFRNELPLKKQDLVFIFVNGNHYMGAGKFNF